MNLVTPTVGAQWDKPASEKTLVLSCTFRHCKMHSNNLFYGRFVEQGLMLSSSFRCDQIQNPAMDFITLCSAA